MRLGMYWILKEVYDTANFRYLENTDLESSFLFVVRTIPPCLTEKFEMDSTAQLDSVLNCTCLKVLYPQVLPLNKLITCLSKLKHPRIISFWEHGVVPS